MIKDNLLSAGVLLESATIVEDHLEGSRFTNAGYEWKVLSQKGDYTLVHAPLKRFQPYVVAWKLSDDGSWGQGHYFNDERAAKSYFKKVTKDLEEDTVRKSNGKWTNRGDDGTEHGEFDTKAEADAQRKAMFAQGYKGESLSKTIRLGDMVNYHDKQYVVIDDSADDLLVLRPSDRFKEADFDDIESGDSSEDIYISPCQLLNNGSLNEKLEGKYSRFIRDPAKSDSGR